VDPRGTAALDAPGVGSSLIDCRSVQHGGVSVEALVLALASVGGEPCVRWGSGGGEFGLEAVLVVRIAVAGRVQAGGALG
jgi:hypothetical protein